VSEKDIMHVSHLKTIKAIIWLVKLVCKWYNAYTC